MKRILLFIAVALLAGCSKDDTGRRYPELYPLVDVPVEILASDIDFRYTFQTMYAMRTDNYAVTALGRTVAITSANGELTNARLLDIKDDMTAHYSKKGLLDARIVGNDTVSLDF